MTAKSIVAKATTAVEIAPRDAPLTLSSAAVTVGTGTDTVGAGTAVGAEVMSES